MKYAIRFALLSWFGVLFAQTPVATVGGSPVFESDFSPNFKSQMISLKNKEYQIKSEALDDAINQKLLELEAKTRNMPPEKLIDQEVDSKVADVPDSEIESFYKAQSARIGRPLEDVRADLRTGLKQMKVQRAREDYFKKLRERYPVSVNLQAPRTEVEVDAQRIRGNVSAPVTIVEFSDFQCPFCQRVQATLLDILSKYQGKVRIAYRDFPLEQIHPDARRAAETSRCAADQGKFWEFHDLLYKDPHKLSEPDLKAHATAVGLDTGKLQGCVASGKYKGSVQKDIDTAIASGVDGAPAFFINGVFLNGAQPFAAFAKIIDDELAKQKRAAAQ